MAESNILAFLQGYKDLVERTGYALRDTSPSRSDFCVNTKAVDVSLATVFMGAPEIGIRWKLTRVGECYTGGRVNAKVDPKQLSLELASSRNRPIPENIVNLDLGCAFDYLTTTPDVQAADEAFVGLHDCLTKFKGGDDSAENRQLAYDYSKKLLAAMVVDGDVDTFLNAVSDTCRIRKLLHLFYDSDYFNRNSVEEYFKLACYFMYEWVSYCSKSK